MKIVLTCGHPNSGFQLVHDALSAAGLAAAQPSRQEALSPAEYYEKMFRAYDQDPSGLGTNSQLSPGKVWQELAVDLFLANMAQDAWGWADSRTIWALDFWRVFDSQTRFVLVYSSPEFAVGQVLRGEAAIRETADRLIAAWTASNLELMRFYNRHPDRCVLVNVSASLNAPIRLVAAIASHFGINIALSDSGYQVDHNEVSAIASSLARALIEDCDEANALYRELESIADIDAGSVTSSAQENLQAWQEYASLVSALTEATAAASENVNAEIEQLKVKLDDLQNSLAVAQSESPRLQNLNAELTQENELMLLQLHQMQDELEQLSLQNQELLNRAQSAPAHVEYSPVHQHGDAFVDMTGPIDGSNWYYAEHDGRWAGPHHTSTIRIPALRDGNYEMWLDVVDAKAREILLGMEVALNGLPLRLVHDGDGVVALVYAQFSTNALAKSPVWEFQFKFPKLISPSEHGSEDLRMLAVRLKSLKLASAG